MGRTACAEPQCLYKGALYFTFTFNMVRVGVYIATNINQMISRKVLPCFVVLAHKVKRNFYCTAKLMITKWLNILLAFAFPSIYSHEQIKRIIVPSQQ
jgi:hypothetical protein